MSQVHLTGNAALDGLLWGYKWDISQMTFSFPTSTSVYGYSVTGFQAFNAAQQSAAERAFAEVASFTGLTFTETTSAGATIRFGEADTIDVESGTLAGVKDIGTGWGTPPDPESFAANMHGDIWYNHDTYNDPALGSFSYRGIMHEIGHSLGLKHGQQAHTLHGETFGELPAHLNSNEFSLMTYPTFVGDTEPGNNAAQHPTSYMQLDIAALQHLYGANFGFRGGNTVYRWSESTGEQFVNGVGQGAPVENFIYQTVWDGGGTDTYDFSNHGDGIEIDLAPGAWSIADRDQLAEIGSGHTARGNVANALLFQGNTASLIENAIGGARSDVLNGNVARNTLTGGGGSDDLNGRTNRDVLIGGTGNDEYILGDVTYIAELVVARTASVTPGPVTLPERTVYDTVQELAGGGTDTVRVGRASDGQHVRTSYVLTDHVENGIVTGTGAFDLTGNGLDNRLDGNGAANRLSGSAGRDMIDGGYGDDLLQGGAGDDTYYLEDIANPPVVAVAPTREGPPTGPPMPTAFGSRLDTVVEAAGAGTDTVIIDAGAFSGLSSYTLADNVETAIVLGTRGFALTGNALDNRLSGNEGGNRLDGGLGADVMQGRAGNDVYVVDHAGDRVDEAAGTAFGDDLVEASVDFSLAANVERLSLTGAGHIDGTGNDLRNTIAGNSGGNLIDGGAGNDTLSGRGGSDVFLFDTALTLTRPGPGGIAIPIRTNLDHITDFSVPGDGIQLDNAIFTALGAPGRLSGDMFKTITTGAQDANDHILYNARTGTLFYDADGAGGRAAIAFAVLDTKPAALGAGDFLVV